MFIKLYEFLFGCYHDWEPWSDVKTIRYERDPDLTNPKEQRYYLEGKKIQYSKDESNRICKKCKEPQRITL